MKNQATENKPDLDLLISQNEPLLKAFIRRRVSNKDDADDILQDVFYQLISTLNKAMNPIEHVSAWLYRVARNTIINKGKKKKEQTISDNINTEEGDNILENLAEVLWGDNSNSPETEYIRSLVWEELELALDKLPQEQRDAFVLMELDGLSAKEVAEVMDVSVNTLLSRKHYAVKHLRLHMEGLYNDLVNNS